jgi:tetratricopeptide (TPR) repeat protein
VKRVALTVLLATLGAGCATMPNDPFVRAERAMQRLDFAAALAAYDAVPVAHERYPEARAAAVAVELGMRHCFELMLEALLLRAEWRDEEALVAMQQAREVWPSVPGIEVLMTATQQRLRLFDTVPVARSSAGRPAASPAGEVAIRSLPVIEAPAPAPAPAAEAPGVAVESLPPLPTDEAPVAVPAPFGPPPPPTARPPQPQPPAPVADGVAAALVAVEAKLARRDLEAAILDLLDLVRRYPDDARVRLRLARLLHQRALLRYGSGSLEPAIRDWERVLEFDAKHPTAATYLDQARRELVRRRRPISPRD